MACPDPPRNWDTWAKPAQCIVIFRIAQRIRGKPWEERTALAEEAHNQAWVDLLSNIRESNEKEQAEPPWVATFPMFCQALETAAWHYCCKVWKTEQKTRDRFRALPSDLAEPTSQAPSMEEIQTCLAQLPEQEQRILEIFFHRNDSGLPGPTLNDLADILCASEEGLMPSGRRSRADRLLRRAKASLRRELLKRGIVPGDWPNPEL